MSSFEVSFNRKKLVVQLGTMRVLINFDLQSVGKVQVQLIAVVSCGDITALSQVCLAEIKVKLWFFFISDFNWLIIRVGHDQHTVFELLFF